MKAIFNYDDYENTMRVEFVDVPKDHRGLYQTEKYTKFLKEISYKAQILIKDAECYTK